MKKTFKILLASSALCGVSQGAVTLSHYYSLGETAGDVTDSVGSIDFTTGDTPGSAAGGASGSIGSTAYATYGAGEFSTGADYVGGLANNNFAFGVWMRTSAITTAPGNIFGTGTNNNAADFTTHRGSSASTFDALGASVQGISWVGPARGVSGALVADTWTHLAFVRDNGASSFYINGVQQGGTTGTAVTHGAGYLGDQDNQFTGGMDVDDLRIYTFGNGEGSDAVAAMFTAVPEPSSTLMLGLGGLALIMRRRK